MLGPGGLTTSRWITILREPATKSREEKDDSGTRYAALHRSPEAAPGDGSRARVAGPAPPGRRPTGRVPARRPGPSLAYSAVRGLRRLRAPRRVPRPVRLPALGCQRRPVGRRLEGRVDPAGGGLPPL